MKGSVNTNTQSLSDKLFRFFNSKDLRKLQTILTTAANNISENGPIYRLFPLLPKRDQLILKDAVRIFRTLRDQISHRKEVELRAERKRREWLAHCKRCRRSLVEKLLPLPVKPDLYVDILSWRLFLGELFHKPSFYFPTNQCAYNELNRFFQKSRSYLPLSAIILDFRQEIYQGISENLWKYDKEPAEAELIDLISKFETSWKGKITINNHSIIKAVEREVLISKANNIERLDLR